MALQLNFSSTWPSVINATEAVVEQDGGLGTCSYALLTLLVALVALAVAQLFGDDEDGAGSTRRVVPALPKSIPGPAWLPIIGNLPSMTHGQSLQPYELINHFAKQYGGMYGVYVGSSPLVVISDPAVVKETFVKHAHVFIGRNDHPVIDTYYSLGKQGKSLTVPIPISHQCKTFLI